MAPLMMLDRILSSPEMRQYLNEIYKRKQMTTMIGNEAAQLDSNAAAENETETAPELFSYRQFSKAVNRLRYLDELKTRDK